ASARSAPTVHCYGPDSHKFANGKPLQLIDGTGLLSRCHQPRLQNAARRSADVPYGLWLLCPSENPKATPNLDGSTVEAIAGEAEWAVLGKNFLPRLSSPATAMHS